MSNKRDNREIINKGLIDNRLSFNSKEWCSKGINNLNKKDSMKFQKK